MALVKAVCLGIAGIGAYLLCEPVIVMAQFQNQSGNFTVRIRQEIEISPFVEFAVAMTWNLFDESASGGPPPPRQLRCNISELWKCLRQLSPGRSQDGTAWHFSLVKLCDI